MKYLTLLIVFINLALLAQAKFEPPYGAYPGAFVVLDNGFNNGIQLFEQKTSKKHATYFNYAGWGQEFPSAWVADYASRNNVVQIAFEPNGGLDEVVDGDYIREWARNARRSGAMILLRWASEMNGNWVAWYGNPSKYIEKFRLIHNIMKEEAPNVAMVWAPNDIPAGFNLYYPGDEYVDWVGIDFYGVYFYEDGTPERGDPRTKLRSVYDVYANRKPIIICEWAATHYTERVTPHQSIVQYCITQMDTLYNSFQTQFPKLKAFNWFSVNSITTNKNDFSLSDNDTVLNHYKQIIQNGYFRTTPYRNVPLVKINLKEDSVFYDNFVVPISIVCDTTIDSTAWYLNGIRVGSVNARPSSVQIDLLGITDNMYILKIIAYAKSGYYNYETVRVVIDKNHNYTMLIQDDLLSNSNFVTTGSWSTSTSQSGYYGGYYHYAYQGDGSSKASWKFRTSKSGSYNVYAWWTISENRASNAPYIVYSKNRIDTVKVNQKFLGGKWNLLGTYNFDSTATITLTNNADGFVIADALKLEWAFTTEVRFPKEIVADKFYLYQNYPNPFNNSTVIQYYTPQTSEVEIKIYNAIGKEIKLLFKGYAQRGMHNINFSADNLASGVYFCRVKFGENFASRKIILLK